jgi:F-type H+-transporting ATPase subunit epsilon
MLPETINLQVVTPERQLVNEAVSGVQLPGRNGALGILPGHAPLMTELGVGELSFRTGRDTHYLAVVHGYAEVLGDRVVVLAEACERAEEVDVDRARSSKERAEKRLAKRDDADTDWDRAQFALQRALVRLQVASKAGAVAPEAETHPHAAP